MVCRYSTNCVMQGIIQDNCIHIDSINGITNKELRGLTPVFRFNGFFMFMPNSLISLREFKNNDKVELLIKLHIKVHHGMYAYSGIVYKARKPKCVYGLKPLTFITRWRTENELTED